MSDLVVQLGFIPNTDEAISAFKEHANTQERKAPGSVAKSIDKHMATRKARRLVATPAQMTTLRAQEKKLKVSTPLSGADLDIEKANQAIKKYQARLDAQPAGAPVTGGKTNEQHKSEFDALRQQKATQSSAKSIPELYAALNIPTPEEKIEAEKMKRGYLPDDNVSDFDEEDMSEFLYGSLD
ncbi:hypothetical protein [Rathayibacter sp. Leaf299]|uniref:hypothetical protein n=1 Tax=Rathayibacter sp. Leaf299 TaxID=1736328 RepID=UPI0012FAE7FD|nr:hypothetical protein [Rathayibacter sp. Leaf299]